MGGGLPASLQGSESVAASGPRHFVRRPLGADAHSLLAGLEQTFGCPWWASRVSSTAQACRCGSARQCLGRRSWGNVSPGFASAIFLAAAVGRGGRRVPHAWSRRLDTMRRGQEGDRALTAGRLVCTLISLVIWTTGGLTKYGEYD